MRKEPTANRRKRFPGEVLDVFQSGKGLRLRAGTGDHRFIGIWFVLVKNRLFVRSWSIKADGWYRTFLKEPHGAIQVANLEIPIRAVRIRNEGVRNAVDRAYLDKYNTPGALKYSRDLVRPKSKATTTELLPL
jgi:hypothetical protein